MERYLIEKALEYYPKRIDGLDSTYMQQLEIGVLKSKMTTAIAEEYHLWTNEIENFNQKKCLLAVDKSNFLISNPSFSLQILLEKDSKYSKVLSYYSSMLIPYFYFTEIICDNSTNKIVEENRENFKLPIGVKIFLDKINYRKKALISVEYLGLIIPEISFETIPDGKFTVMNAFFNPMKEYL